MTSENLADYDLTVVLDNDFNEITIKGLTKDEHSMLMSIMNRLKNQDTRTIEIGLSFFSSSLGRKMEPAEAVTLAEHLWNKVKLIDYTPLKVSRTGKIMKMKGGIPLFGSWLINVESGVLSVSINHDLEYFVNDFGKGNYSSFKLEEFTNFKTIYSQRLFVLLNQWGQIGKTPVIKKEDLMERLDVSDSYYDSTKNFHSKILNKAIKEVRERFPGLEVHYEKFGRTITGYYFTFERQKHNVSYKRKDVTPKKTKTPKKTQSTKKPKHPERVTSATMPTLNELFTEEELKNMIL